MKQGQGGNTRLVLWGLLMIALALRLGFVLFYEQYPPFLGDDAGFDSVGLSLAKGRGFVKQADPSSGVADIPFVESDPGYPFFLAMIYFLFGHSVTAVRVIQAILGAATVFLVFQVALAAFGERIALLSCLLTAIYPPLIIYSGVILSETLFAFLLMFSVWAMMMAAKDPLPLPWLRAGVLSGLTVLLRAETIVVVLFFVGLVIRCGQTYHKVRNLLILSVAVALMVGTWTLWNYLVFKEVILVSTNSAKALWISTVGWNEFRDEAFWSSVRGMGELERAPLLYREGIKNILSHPILYLRLCFVRLAHFWLGSHTTYFTGFTERFQAYYARGELARVFVKGIFLSVNTWLLGLALWGARDSVLKERKLRYLRLICLQPVIAIAVVHFFLFATSRYQVPVLPLLLIFSAVGVGKALSHMGIKAVVV